MSEQEGGEKNINFILKSDTETAFAYLKSEFFSGSGATTGTINS